MDRNRHDAMRKLNDDEKQRLLNAMYDPTADIDRPNNVLLDKELEHEDVPSKETDENIWQFLSQSESHDQSHNAIPLMEVWRKWSLREDTQRHEHYRLRLVRNKMLEAARKAAGKEESRLRLKKLIREPRHAYDLVEHTNGTERPEAFGSFAGDTLKRFTFEMSTEELHSANNEASELDPKAALIVRMFDTGISLKQKVWEIRSAGANILARDSEKTHLIQHDSVEGTSLISSFQTPDVIHLAVPQYADTKQSLLGCIGSGAVRVTNLNDWDRQQSFHIHNALSCGAWLGSSALLVGGKEHVSSLDIRQATANLMWARKSSHVADICSCWWEPNHVAVTTSDHRYHTLKIFDVRSMERPLDDMVLPERGSLQNKSYPLHPNRYFEVGWSRQRSNWLYTFCLGGYDTVYRSMGEAGATASFHDDLRTFEPVDACMGCAAVKLANKSQAGMALVHFMHDTGPSAVWLEQPQVFAATSVASPASATLEREKTPRETMVDSLIDCIISSLSAPVSKAQKETVATQMLERLGARTECLSEFAFLWELIQEQICRISDIDADNACLAILDSAGQIRLLLSDGQCADIPTNEYSRLSDESNEYLCEKLQVANISVVIPLLLVTNFTGNTLLYA